MESRLHCLVWHKDHRSERCDTRISSPIRLHADFGLRCHCIETSRPMLRCSVCTTQKMLWVWSKRKSTNPSFRNAWRWTNWRVPPTECLFLNQAPPQLPSWLCWLRNLPTSLKSPLPSGPSAAFETLAMSSLNASLNQAIFIIFQYLGVLFLQLWTNRLRSPSGFGSPCCPRIHLGVQHAIWYSKCSTSMFHCLNIVWTSGLHDFCERMFWTAAKLLLPFQTRTSDHLLSSCAFKLCGSLRQKIRHRQPGHVCSTLP